MNSIKLRLQLNLLYYINMCVQVSYGNTSTDLDRVAVVPAETGYSLSGCHPHQGFQPKGLNVLAFARSQRSLLNNTKYLFISLFFSRIFLQYI